jgi:hypothetical protein
MSFSRNNNHFENNFDDHRLQIAREFSNDN